MDAPCGDFHWMRYCDLRDIEYVGIDIVPDLIAQDMFHFGGHHREFRVGDIVRDQLPRVDLVLCRDCLVHLTSDEIFAAVRNLARSGSTYLLTTTFVDVESNEDLGEAGGWRPLNLCRPPFCFPEPAVIINEGCTEQNGKYSDKSLALWTLSDLRPLVTEYETGGTAS